MFIQQSCKFAEQLQPKVAKAYEDEIIKPRTSKLSRGLITLENLFDCYDTQNDKRKFTVDKGYCIKLKVAEGKNRKVGKNVPQ